MSGDEYAYSEQLEAGELTAEHLGRRLAVWVADGGPITGQVYAGELTRIDSSTPGTIRLTLDAGHGWQYTVDVKPAHKLAIAKPSEDAPA